MLSGFKPDVTHICAGSVNKWIEAGVIEPWDTSKITEYDQSRQEPDRRAGRPATSTDVYFIPTYFGSTAISYNTEEVPAEDVASLDVFLNPKYAGRLTIPDNVDDAYALAYLATGVTNWSNVTDDQFKAASDWLRKVHPQPAHLLDRSRPRWRSCWPRAKCWSPGPGTRPCRRCVDQGFPDRLPARRQGRLVAVALRAGQPEGRAGQSEDKAYDYVNAFLDASSTQALMDGGYGQANKPAMDALGTETR